MTLTINDKATEVAEGATLASLGISEKGTAVAVNGKLVRREAWDETVLADGDKLIIISAAYGG